MPTSGPLRKAFFAVAMAIGCGSSSPPNPRLTGDVPIPNIAPATNFSFDLGAVDDAGGRYYFTDRNNKAVDVIDIKTNALIAQIPGFAGCNPNASCAGVNNALSGPDGINVIPGSNFIYVGDVNSVKVVDKTTNTIVKTIAVSTSAPGLRADEGCFDPDDNIFMIASPEESPPFATFISTTSQAVIGKINFPTAAGLEQCAYDHGTRSFLVNNDGTLDTAGHPAPPNPDGEIDVIPASFITSGAAGAAPSLPAPSGTNGFKVFPLGNCDPTGMALGPGNDVAISCRPGTVGTAMNVLILDRTNGSTLATVNAGGSDQIAYDSVSNRYYAASSRWNDSGKTVNPGDACTTSNPCTPVLNIIDASNRTLVTRLPTGNNAHSVAVSGTNHKVFVPYSSAAVPAGCATAACAATFPNGGISIYATQ
jgi:hypothetical protein